MPMRKEDSEVTGGKRHRKYELDSKQKKVRLLGLRPRNSSQQTTSLLSASETTTRVPTAGAVGSAIPIQLTSATIASDIALSNRSIDVLQPNADGDGNDYASATSDPEDLNCLDLMLDDETTALKEAFDKTVRPFIDLVDDLRRHGLERDINLPSAVVIGDQSSGKSSILETISGVQLPRGAGIVTRCPLEMQLKRTFGHSSWEARLTYRTLQGKEEVKTITDPDTVEDLIRTAQDEMAGDNKGISKNLITLRIESPYCPDVTLIDLPGIARTPVGDQPVDIAHQIKSLLTSYIERENTIILCVIPCNVDIAVNEALSMAKAVDPDGSRTLGVLTKPDLVDKGNEPDVIAILENQKFYLRKGYNIVRCRGQQDIMDGIDLKTAMEKEDQFFKDHHVFRKIDPDNRGTEKLAFKLTNTLVEHIKKTLPKLREEVRRNLEEVRKRLDDLGVGPPTEEGQKRLFLMKTVDAIMQKISKALKQGDRIPGRAMPNPAVHGIKLAFDYNSCYFWRNRFHVFKYEITNITKENFEYGELTVEKIEEKMNRYRGRELPCFLNIELFEKLIREHVDRYRHVINQCCTNISNDVESILSHILNDLNHLPIIKGRFRGVSEETRDNCRTEAFKLLQFEIEKEMLVFSQDDTYLRQLRYLVKKLKKNSNDKQSRDRGNDENPDLLAFTISDAKDNRKNAEVMQRLINVYLDVANRRILDNVPMILRCTQHINFVDLLHERLRMICAGDEVEELVTEAPQLMIDRKRATERAERLTHAITKLNYIA